MALIEEDRCDTNVLVTGRYCRSPTRELQFSLNSLKISKAQCLKCISNEDQRPWREGDGQEKGLF